MDLIFRLFTPNRFFAPTKLIAAGLVPLLAAMPVRAESPVAESSPVQLQLHLMDSDGSRVVAGSRSTHGITVLVTNTTGTPVPEAAVAFRFPESGPTAMFGDGTRSAVAYTDASGSAHISGFQWGEPIGPTALRVTASKGNSHAGLLIEQNVMSGIPAAPIIVHEATVPSSEADAVIATPVTPVPQKQQEAAASKNSEDETASAYVAPLAPAPAIPSATPVSTADPLASFRAARLGLAPAVSITSTNPRDLEYHAGFSKKKWIILGIAAGAGVGIALALLSAKSSSAAASSGLSVGSPTISISHP